MSFKHYCLKTVIINSVVEMLIKEFDNLLLFSKSFILKKNNNLTLGEMLDILKDNNENSIKELELNFLYSKYVSDLFKMIADEIELISFCRDVENEYNSTITKEPNLINIAIFRYIINKYSNFRLKDANINLLLHIKVKCKNCEQILLFPSELVVDDNTYSVYCKQCYFKQ